MQSLCGKCAQLFCNNLVIRGRCINRAHRKIKPPLAQPLSCRVLGARGLAVTKGLGFGEWYLELYRKYNEPFRQTLGLFFFYIIEIRCALGSPYAFRSGGQLSCSPERAGGGDL